jgi:hypothetical protein
VAVAPVQTEVQSPNLPLPSREQSDTQGRGDSMDLSLKQSNDTYNLSVIASGSTNGSVSDARRVSVREEITSLQLSSPPPNTPSLEGTAVNVDIAYDRETAMESSLTGINEDSLASHDQQVRRVIELQDPDILEAGVAQAMQIAKSLKRNLSHYIGSKPHTEAASWVQAIDKLIPQAERKRTVIGVVGNTGAGKSSVINAMLEEERLVPTNCMRACTAVVTEISWNNRADASKYRAEIEFISREDWEKELTILMQEFLSANGRLSREAQDSNSDAGIAWAKYKAVYPHEANERLLDTPLSALMSNETVVDVLGTTKEIMMDRPEEFHLELQKYADSKEKVSKKRKRKGVATEEDQNQEESQAVSLEMEYWPLIKVVRIYTTSSALSTGAVIVDLPGFHDSNAARAAVAQNYKKQCTGFWIVAPINRAVDDKTAKKLLGDSFKRQLQFDGGVTGITFICSKTDDISITEAISSLQLEEETEQLDEDLTSYTEQIKTIQDQIDMLKPERKAQVAALKTISAEINLWKKLQDRIARGKPAYAPATQINEHGDEELSEQPRKKRAVESESEYELSNTDDEISGSEDEIESQAERTRVSETNVRDKLKDLIATKKNTQRELKSINVDIKELKYQLRPLQVEENKLRMEITHICIATRNFYSKTAIQQDFAAGIKEIDQENAAREDEDNFDPDEEMRDYDEVANSLPVFCISSRAFQKMCGRMKKDGDVLGFTSPEHTEIPQLQAHCRKLTESGRTQTSRTFLTGFCKLLTTFKLRASNDNADLMLTEEEKQHQISYLKGTLAELNAGLDEIVRDYGRRTRSTLETRILSNWPKLIRKAIKDAPARASA